MLGPPNSEFVDCAAPPNAPIVLNYIREMVLKYLERYLDVFKQSKSGV